MAPGAEKGRTEQAKKSLLWLRPDKDAVDGEIFSVQQAINEAKDNSGKALFLEMFRNPIDRRRTLLAVGAVNTQAASGAMFIIVSSSAHPQQVDLLTSVSRPMERIFSRWQAWENRSKTQLHL